LGHANYNLIKQIENRSNAKGFKIIGTKNRLSQNCDICSLAKLRQKKIPKKRTRSQDEEDKVASGDTLGPIRQSRNGFKYAFFIGNRGLVKVYFLKRKNEAYTKIKEYFKEIERQHGIDFICKFRGDNEFDNETLNKFFKENGIVTEFTVPYTPFQNGRAERFNQTIMNMARAMLIGSGLPNSFWTYAIEYAVYVRNRLSSSSDKDQRSGYERVYNKKPDLSQLRTFGETCYYKDPKAEGKVGKRGKQAKFIGFDGKRKGHLLYIPSDRTIVPAREPTYPTEEPDTSESSAEIKTPVSIEIDTPTEPQDENQTKPSTNEYTPPVTRSQTKRTTHEVNIVTCEYLTKPTKIKMKIASIGGGPRLRKLERIKNQIKRIVHEVNIVTSEYLKEPVNFRDVWKLNPKERLKWLQAMVKEMNALIKNGTFKRTKRTPGKNVIGNRWVYKLKKEDNGATSLYKARLVAKGFKQKYKEDYENTYSPVAGKASLRILVILAQRFNLVIHQYDVPSAYVKASLKGEQIDIELPDGFKGLPGDVGNLTTPIDDPDTGEDPSEVLRLLKGLYGLKQSGMYWNREIHEKLCKLGLQSMKSDKCLYFLNNGTKIVIVLLYVDDILIASNWNEKKDWIVSELVKTYEIKELGKVNQFLGMKITQQENGTSFISQETFVETFINELNLQLDPKRSTPLDTNERFEKNDDPIIEPRKYQQLLGKLIYLSTCTRPDIAYAVSQAAKFNQSPTLKHWKQLKKIAAYVNSSKDYGLYINTERSKSQTVSLEVYTDADWANCVDTRKSVSGIVILLWGCPVVWSSKQQTIVATSTCLAEIVAACSGLIEADKTKELLEELKFIENIESILYMDNMPAINLIQNDKPPTTMKHLSIKYHSTRDKIQNGSYKVQHCRTENMLADIFTKSLDKNKFTTLRKKLCVVPFKK